ncbi:MAG: tetratricopeptide repeat protein [Deltaproteobacteria bacterium]|nr:MAG: tetratricopeptide repeat protein [Deltaproteobacteria bacterium]
MREDSQLAELRGQLAAQSEQIAAQQRRIDELEVKVAAVASRAEPKTVVIQAPAQPAAAAAATKPAVPAKDPRPHLKTVKLSPRMPRHDFNPVERAPRIPSTIALRDPDEQSLASLDDVPVDAFIRAEVEADHSFASAVRELNDGQLASAEADLLAFVQKYPRHNAADNALYLAGLIRQNRGDCESAVPLFDRVPREYPAGDSVAPALLEKGRCLRMQQHAEEARRTLSRLLAEHPQAVEVTTARQILQSLEESQSGRP